MKRVLAVLAGLVVIVLIAVLAAPSLVDRSRVKGEIEARLERATGRDVVLDGPVGLRLLPTPTLTAERLSIGNPKGIEGKLATVERLNLRVRLLPLLSGRIEIAALALDKPVVALAQDRNGRANWQFGEKAPAPSPTPETGRPTLRGEPPPQAGEAETWTLGDATITAGTVTYQEAGGPVLRLDSIDARVAAGGPSGPFSAEGRATAEGVPVRFDAAMDRIAPGRGSPVNLALSHPDSDAKLDFAGMLSDLSDGRTLRGRLTLAAADPARTLAALGKPQPLPPGALAAEGTLAINAAEASATDLVVSLGELRANGSASVGFGAMPHIEADLHVAALDLDKWIGRSAPAAGQPATGKPAAGTPAPAAPPAPDTDGGFALPKDVFADFKLAADTVGWRGEVVREARIVATLTQGELVLRRAAAQLPGGSTLTAEGSVVAAKGRPLFDGSLRLGSDNPRALLAWLGTDSEAVPPGRLDLASPVKVAWPEVALPDFRLTLGGDTTQGRLKARLGQPLAVDLAAATRKYGEVAATGTLDGEAVDGRATVLGATVTVQGHLGEAPRLTVAAPHPDAAQLLRRLADLRPRGPLGALALDAKVSGQGVVWDVADLRLTMGALALTGQARADLSGTKPLITAELAGNDLALDPFLAPERTGQLLPGGPHLPPTIAPSARAILPAAAAPSEPPWSREPMDLSALDAVNARIGLKASAVSARGWRLDNANARLGVQDGTATVDNLTGALLGGTLSLAARLTRAGALSGQFTIANADVAAVKPGAGGLSVTQGRLDADARFTASGRSTFEMVSRLDGDGRLLVKDGIIAGFDLPAVGQRLKNLDNVGSLLGLVQSGLTGGQTRFASLAGTFQARNGVVVTRDLKLDAQGGGATAESTTDLPRWTTATTIALRLAESSAPPLLVRIEGPLGNPRKVIDANALQQYLAARGLGRALKGKDGGLVDQLLGGKRPPAPEAAPNAEQTQPSRPTGRDVLQDVLKGLGGR